MAFKKGEPAWNKGLKGFLKGQKRPKQSLAMTGRTASQATRDKLSKSLKGKPQTGGSFKNGHKQLNTGRTWFKKIGEGTTSEYEIIRHSKEYKLWRISVFERDNYTCIWCSSKENIQADHIKPFVLYPELRFAIDNGRTLCFLCHKTTDTYGGNSIKLKKHAK